MVLAQASLLGMVGGGATPTPNPAFDAYLKPQTVAVLPDGRRAHFFCEGEGKPIAILESGWGTPTFAWASIQAKFAKITRVCAFDRAGYGFSDPGPMPRDSAAGVKDLHEALKAAGMSPPFVLVGHSLGGFDARLYAYTHPDEVAGLLLIDPPTEDLYRRTRQPDEDVANTRKCMTLAKAHSLVPGAPDGCVDDPETALGPTWSAAMKAQFVADQSRISWFETLLSEDLAMVNQSADELAAARHQLGKLPLVVLQADTDCQPVGEAGSTPAAKLDVARCAALERQAHESTRGQRRVVTGAKHYIYEDKPGAVVRAFREIVAAAR